MVNVTCDMCWATIKTPMNMTGAITMTFNKVIGFSPMEFHVCNECLRKKKRFWFEINNALYVEEEEKKDEQGN